MKPKTIDELVSAIQHKASQLRKAEERVKSEGTIPAINNERSVRRNFHQLACQLAKMTDEECKTDNRSEIEGVEN